MGSNFYYYFGLFAEWIKENKAVSGRTEKVPSAPSLSNADVKKVQKTKKVKGFDELPVGFW
ncbi:MAG: hypothetical protein FWG65_10250 [Turicibacter sp.]|nr:hypothetical protein [Turicibacter sp.]